MRKPPPLAEQYEGVSAARIYADLTPSLSISSGLALDVGAGSGRDAAWLATLGYEVVAVEPAAGMRREGAQRHPSLPLRWVDDDCPTSLLCTDWVWRSIWRCPV